MINLPTYMVIMKVMWKNEHSGHTPRIIQGLIDLSEHLNHPSVFSRNIQIALSQPDEAKIELQFKLHAIQSLES